MQISIFFILLLHINQLFFSNALFLCAAYFLRIYCARAKQLDLHMDKKLIRLSCNMCLVGLEHEFMFLLFVCECMCLAIMCLTSFQAWPRPM